VALQLEQQELPALVEPLELEVPVAQAVAVARQAAADLTAAVKVKARLSSGPLQQATKTCRLVTDLLPGEPRDMPRWTLPASQRHSRSLPDQLCWQGLR
jgi:hypothetical protein